MQSQTMRGAPMTRPSPSRTAPLHRRAPQVTAGHRRMASLPRCKAYQSDGLSPGTRCHAVPCCHATAFEAWQGLQVS